MLSRPDPCDAECPSRELLELIGSKWTILIICSLQSGPKRTGELMRSVGGISQKMFTQTVRALEHNGLVDRVSYPQVPPRVEYRLSPLGRSLSKLLSSMEAWVIKNYPAVRVRRNASFANGRRSVRPSRHCGE
ncbi:MAG: helix-turn-helix domain-containing protein [Hyphomicrobium sp.]|nr:helix-turn-helix domain-containing protein [Hyphomicrobium sp.]